jgi:excisionase family DNA binding protein
MRTQYASSVSRQKVTLAHIYADKPTDKDGLAEYFGVSRRTVDYWIADGKINYIKINRTVRFRIADIERAFTVKGRVK